MLTTCTARTLSGTLYIPAGVTPEEVLTELSRFVGCPYGAVPQGQVVRSAPGSAAVMFLYDSGMFAGWTGWLPLSEQYRAAAAESFGDSLDTPAWQSSTFLVPRLRGRKVSVTTQGVQQRLLNRIVTAHRTNVRAGLRFHSIVKSDNVPSVKAMTRLEKENPHITEIRVGEKFRGLRWWRWDGLAAVR